MTDMPFCKFLTSAIMRIFLIGLTVICTWGVLQAAGQIADAYRARSWIVTTGLVLTSKVEVGCSKGASYYPKIEYRYEVAGAVHTGSQIAFGNIGCGSRQAAAEIIAKYSIGQRISVYSNPTNPKQAVVMVGDVFLGTWFQLVFMSLFAILIAIQTWRHFKQGNAIF